MSLEQDWTLAGLIHEKDKNFDAIIGGTGDRLQASEAFAEKAQQVYDYASNTDNCSTLCFMSNVRRIQQQTETILQTAGRDNEVLNVIAPLAQELHVRL